MKKINISYESGHIFSVYLVRYFRFENNAYFIYTLQEKDDRDYMKLYVVKVMKELNHLVTQTVRRPDEWNKMKLIVKRILSEIKKQELTCIEDLDPFELENIVIYENKSFHIATDLANILATEILSDKNSNIETAGITKEEELQVDDKEESEVEVLELNDSDENTFPNSEIETLEL